MPAQVTIIPNAEADSSFNLTTTGLERAGALPYYITSTPQIITPRFPSSLFGARETAAEPGRAILQTATPTSALLKEPIHFGFSSTNPGKLAHEILTKPIYNGQNVLVVWNVDSINSLITAFGFTNSVTPANNLVFILSFPPTPNVATVLMQDLLCGDCSGPPTPPNPSPPPFISATTLPFVLVNNTGHPDADVFVLFFDNFGDYLSFGTGMTQPGTLVAGMVGDMGTQSTTYSYPLSALPPDGNGNHVVYVPYMSSARAYISIDHKLSLNVAAGPSIQPPPAVVTSDLNFNTLWDFMEFTFTTSGNQVTINTTAVDAFGLPLWLYLSTAAGGGSNAQNVGFFQPRQTILTGVQSSFTTDSQQISTRTQWNKLFAKNTNGGQSTVRVLSPKSGIGFVANMFDSNYLDNPTYGYQYLTDVIKGYYSTHTLSIQAASGIIYAGVADIMGKLTLTSSMTGLNVIIDYPTTLQVFSGTLPIDVASTAPAADQAQVAQYLAASIVSGLLPATTSTVISQPYLRAQVQAGNAYQYNALLTPPGPTDGPWYDLYSKALYAFGTSSYSWDFDDVLYTTAAPSSPIFIPNLTYVGITIESLAGTVLPP